MSMIKIKNEMDLTLNERFVYMTISRICNTNKYTRLSRATLCEMCNIKEPKTITAITNSLNKKKLISKIVVAEQNVKKTQYKVINYDSSFLLFTSDLFSVDASNSAIAIATLLAPLRYKGTNKIQMPIKTIAEKINVSRNTLKKYLKELSEAGVIDIVDYTIYINEEYFPLFVYKTKNAKDYEKCLKDMPKDSKAYKKFMNAYSKGYDGIDNIEAFLWSLLNDSEKDNANKAPKEYDF